MIRAPSSPRILVVDDDAAIRRTLIAELSVAGYETTEARDGAEALRLFESDPPELLLTDLAMPESDGFALIAAVRKVAKTPILVLSVRAGDTDKIRALDLGADDYVVKPFSVQELLARVRAQLRRSLDEEAPAPLEFPGLSIDRERRRVVQDGREIRLTPTEFSILELLAIQAGKPVTIRQIIGRVWHGAPGTTPDAVRVHVGSLRRKIEPDSSRPRYIITEPWIGYRFVAGPMPPPLRAPENYSGFLRFPVALPARPSHFLVGVPRSAASGTAVAPRASLRRRLFAVGTLVSCAPRDHAFRGSRDSMRHSKLTYRPFHGMALVVGAAAG